MTAARSTPSGDCWSASRAGTPTCTAASSSPPDDDGADLGVLFWHKDGYSTACGHGTIALGAWAVDIRPGRGARRRRRSTSRRRPVRPGDRTRRAPRRPHHCDHLPQRAVVRGGPRRRRRHLARTGAGRRRLRRRALRLPAARARSGSRSSPTSTPSSPRSGARSSGRSTAPTSRDTHRRAAVRRLRHDPVRRAGRHRRRPAPAQRHRLRRRRGRPSRAAPAPRHGSPCSPRPVAATAQADAPSR